MKKHRYLMLSYWAQSFIHLSCYCIQTPLLKWILLTEYFVLFPLLGYWVHCKGLLGTNSESPPKDCGEDLRIESTYMHREQMYKCKLNIPRIVRVRRTVNLPWHRTITHLQGQAQSEAPSTTSHHTLSDTVRFLYTVHLRYLITHCESRDSRG